MELLKIANGYLPRVRLEYDRVKSELNSWKAELNNIVKLYQNFCDRNMMLRNREDELQLSISELERKETRLNKSISEFQENDILTSRSKKKRLSQCLMY